MATIWDTNQKSANITLTGGSLVATATGTANLGVRATRVTTGPVYMEMTATLISTSFVVGFADYAFAPASTVLGADTHGIGYKQDGTVKINGSTLGTIATYTTADRVGIAYHPQFQLFWARVNNGNWNNNVANNPASATLADAQGGLSTATLTGGSTGSLFPAFQTSGTTNAAVTAKFSTAFTDTAPTGFVTVDTTGAVGFAPEQTSGAKTFVGGARANPVTDVNQLSPYTGTAYGNYSGTKTVSGNVKQAGANIAGKKVHLFDRVGNFLGLATTDASGNYTIKGRGRNSTIVIALDDPNYNALVYDVVAPV